MQVRNRASILVVGGGIGGLATALALSRKGVPVHVLEQAPAFREIGAGIQMPPNAFCAFEALGILEAIQAVAAYPEHLMLGDMLSGEIVYRAPIDEAFVQRYGFRYALLHRGDVLERLLEACRATDLVTLTGSARVTGFTETVDGVTVETASGTQYTGAAMVACDGLWSLSRERLVGDGAPRTDGYVLCRGVVPVDDVPQDLYSQSVTMWGGPGLDFFHYPLRRQEIFNIGGSYYDPHIKPGSEYPQLERGAFMDKFKDACSHVKRLLEYIDVSKSWVLHDRFPIKDWAKGRVVLLGDAAHPTNIYISQGACMALEDAVALAECVDRVQPIEAAFNAFVEARYLRTARIQFTSREFGKLYHARGVQRDLRNHLLAGVTPKALSETLDWLWRDPFEGLVQSRVQ